MTGERLNHFTNVYCIQFILYRYSEDQISPGILVKVLSLDLDYRNIQLQHDVQELVINTSDFFMMDTKIWHYRISDLGQVALYNT